GGLAMCGDKHNRNPSARFRPRRTRRKGTPAAREAASRTKRAPDHDVGADRARTCRTERPLRYRRVEVSLGKERPAMRRVLGEALMSAGTVAVLLIALVAFDDRVREQLSQRFMAQPSAQLASAGHQVRNITSVIAEAARDQSREHAPMLIFALTAAVLVLFMLRT